MGNSNQDGLSKIGVNGSEKLRFLKMTRRAFLSSKSNTGAWEIEMKWACQKCVQMVQKNEDFSESVSSFDSGAIFPPS